MNYFILEFDYPGPRVNSPGDDDVSRAASIALENAIKYAEYLLGQGNIKNKHAYAWTDGSLYRYLESPKQNAELWQDLLNLFKGQKIVSILTLHDQDKNKDPFKASCKTLEEYMNLSDQDLVRSVEVKKSNSQIKKERKMNNGNRSNIHAQDSRDQNVNGNGENAKVNARPKPKVENQKPVRNDYGQRQLSDSQLKNKIQNCEQALQVENSQKYLNKERIFLLTQEKNAYQAEIDKRVVLQKDLTARLDEEDRKAAAALEQRYRVWEAAQNG